MPESVIQDPPAPAGAPRRGQHRTPLLAQATPAAPGARSWAARYGQLILQDGIATLPRALYHHQHTLDLIAQEVWFVSYILAHKWSADTPYPSLKRMAKNSGVDLSWLKRLRQRLVEKGYLQIEERWDAQGGQATNGYDFAPLFARLEEILAQTPVPPNAIRAAEDAPGVGEGSDTTFTARFGRVIAREGIAAVPQALFTYQGVLALSPQEIWFACYILSYQWATDLPYPSINKMVVRTGYSEAHLHAIKNALIDKGYLRVVNRYRQADGGQDNNGYDFSGLLDAINQHLQQAHRPAAPEVAAPPSRTLRRGQRRAVGAAQAAAPATGEGGAGGTAGGGRRGYSRRGAQRVQPEGGAESTAGEGSREGEHAPHNAAVAGGRTQLRQGGGPRVAPGGAPSVVPGAVPTVAPGSADALAAGGVATLAAGGAQRKALIESDQEEPKQKKNDSNPRPTRKREQAPIGEETAYSDSAISNNLSPGNGVPLQASLRFGIPLADSPSAGNRRTDHTSGGGGNGGGGHAQTKPGSGPALPASSYIGGVVMDYSRELGDESHLAANITQALRLYQVSELSEEPFVQLLHEARRRTRQYQGRQGLGVIENKMAYFFQTLRNLVDAILDDKP